MKLKSDSGKNEEKNFWQVKLWEKEQTQITLGVRKWKKKEWESGLMKDLEDI